MHRNHRGMKADGEPEPAPAPGPRTLPVMTTNTSSRARRGSNSKSDWRIARHDFHLATPRDARGEPRPYPLAVPRGGPGPTERAAAPFLPLAGPPPAVAERLSTTTALEMFGFERLQQAVLACQRRERERPRTSDEDRRAAEAAAARIEQLAASMTDTIEVSFDSPRGTTVAPSAGAAARIRLRIDGCQGHGDVRPLTLDVDPVDPLVNPKITAGNTRIDIAPPCLGRLARIAATDSAGFRPPAPAPQMLLGSAHALAAATPVRVRTHAVDESVEARTETCGPEALARLLLARCWPRLTPGDPKNAWVMHLSKRSKDPNTKQTTLARYDRGSHAVLVDDQPLETADGEAVASLVTALRAAGRNPGDHYWTHHRTPYPAGFGKTAP